MYEGLVLALVAAICFALMSLFVKSISPEVHTPIILFFRFFFNLLFVVPWLIQSPSLVYPVKTPFRIFFRNISGLAALGFMFYALKKLPLSNAVLLNNTSVLFLPLLVWLFLRLHTPILVFVGILLGFSGVVLVLRPATPLFLTLFSLAGVGSGFFGSISLFLTRQISKRTSPKQILFYYALWGTVVTAPFLSFQLHAFDWRDWIYLVLMGIFGSLFQISLTFALKHAPARIVSSILLLSVAFSVLLEWLVDHHIPAPLDLMGMGLMLLGSALAILFLRPQAAS